jgi:hypothetical protein
MARWRIDLDGEVPFLRTPNGGFMDVSISSLFAKDQPDGFDEVLDHLKAMRNDPEGSLEITDRALAKFGVDVPITVRSLQALDGVLIVRRHHGDLKRWTSSREQLGPVSVLQPWVANGLDGAEHFLWPARPNLSRLTVTGMFGVPIEALGNLPISMEQTAPGIHLAFFTSGTEEVADRVSSMFIETLLATANMEVACREIHKQLNRVGAIPWLTMVLSTSYRLEGEVQTASLHSGSNSIGGVSGEAEAIQYFGNVGSVHAETKGFLASRQVALSVNPAPGESSVFRQSTSLRGGKTGSTFPGSPSTSKPEVDQSHPSANVLGRERSSGSQLANERAGVDKMREWHLKVSVEGRFAACDFRGPTGGSANQNWRSIPSGRSQPTELSDPVEAAVQAGLDLGSVFGGDLTSVTERFLEEPNGILWVHIVEPVHAAPRWESARIIRNSEPSMLVAQGRMIVRTTMVGEPTAEWNIEDLDRILIVDGEAGRRMRVPPAAGFQELNILPVVESLRDIAPVEVLDQFPTRVRHAILVFLGHGVGAPNNSLAMPYLVAERDVTRDEVVAAVQQLNSTYVVALGCCAGALGSPAVASIAHELSRAGVKFVIGFDGTTDWTAIPAATAFFLSELKRTGDAAVSLRAVNTRLLELRLDDKIPNVVLYSNVKLRAADAPSIATTASLSPASRLFELAIKTGTFDIVQHVAIGGTVNMEAEGGKIAQIVAEAGSVSMLGEGAEVVQVVDTADTVYQRAVKRYPSQE